MYFLSEVWSRGGPSQSKKYNVLNAATRAFGLREVVCGLAIDNH